MTETLAQVARLYLRELDGALAGVPRELRRDILDGVRADLDGLDPAAAAERIEQLGDPAEIAADARVGLEKGGADAPSSTPRAASMPPVASVVAQPAAAPVSPRWYVVVTSLVVAFGGFVIPVVGWVAGIAMMWMSRAWTRWEKWAATLAPLVVGLVGLLVAWLSALADSANSGSSLSGFSGVHLIVLSFGIVPVFTGIWLLVRGLRRL